MAIVPVEYLGREQAFLKHTILKTYLERLFMIIGRREIVINYVDCFAGPWSEESPQLDDTSIGISIKIMKDAAQSLRKVFGREVRFRALYIEKDPAAYRKLDQFLTVNNHAPVETYSIYGDYMEYTDYIAKWTQGCFTFFFVDPKGWKEVISEETLRPLLELDNVEFLINLMYDFVNRAVNIETLNDQIKSLLGQSPSFTGSESAMQRQRWVLTKYRESVNRSYSGRTAFVPVERPGRDRVLYFLIYLTRHPVGISVFKEVAEDMNMVQRITQAETKLRNQVEKSPTSDLFAEEPGSMALVDTHDNRLSAKSFLVNKLSERPLLIDNECWAGFLEETDFYPSDIQMAMKELIHDGVVTVIGKDIKNIKRRIKKPIKPDWPRKSEKWVIIVPESQK
nr:three-Cys-motif partner protein TcmP [Halomonas socia]